jgi:UDP-N-acetylglucosamine--N-acetylmuramyl-(pentapeptide) pyrophosphoryl-undecaprenol N-acetylglucosamine transferase
MDPHLSNLPKYKQYEYVYDELSDILAATDIVITRGGSNAIFEFLALNIPILIFPLGLNQSRGDQILNARVFQNKGYSLTLEEENLTSKTLMENLNTVYTNREKYQKNMKESYNGDALQTLLMEIKNVNTSR